MATAARDYGYEALKVGEHFNWRALPAVSGEATFPQIFIDGKIGNGDALAVFLDTKTAPGGAASPDVKTGKADTPVIDVPESAAVAP